MPPEVVVVTGASAGVGRARGLSLQLWASQHRAWLAAAGLLGTGLLARALRRDRGRVARWRRAGRRQALGLLCRVLR